MRRKMVKVAQKSKKTAAPRKSPDWRGAAADEFLAQPARLTSEERDAIEAHFADARRTRRLLLETMTRSVPQLLETVEESREGAILMAQAMLLARDHEAGLRAFADLARDAGTRLELVLAAAATMTEAQMQGVIKTARAELEAEPPPSKKPRIAGKPALKVVL